jgi:hypothetical protein
MMQDLPVVKVVILLSPSLTVGQLAVVQAAILEQAAPVELTVAQVVVVQAVAAAVDHLQVVKLAKLVVV